MVRRQPQQTLDRATAEALDRVGARTVGFEAEDLSTAALDRLTGSAGKATFRPTRGRVEELRAVKDQSEVELIRAAVRVAERAYVMFRAMLREADTEKDLADALELYVRRAGGRAGAFPTYAAIGEHGARPDALPTDRVLSDGSKVLIRWGADLGYKCDLARAFRSPFPVAPSRRNKAERVGYDFDQVFDAVTAAYLAALGAIRPEATAAEVDAAARAAVADTELAEFYVAELGTGIGLEVREAPTLAPHSDEVLKAGMVLTIAPGIFIPGWGGVQVGESILVTRDGCTALTSAPAVNPAHVTELAGDEESED